MALSWCTPLAHQLSFYQPIFLSPPQPLAKPNGVYTVLIWLCILAGKRGYITVFISASACVHHSVSYLEIRLMEHLTEDVSFSRERETKATPKWYTAPLWGLQEHFLLLVDSPIQVSPAENAQAALTHFFHFYSPDNNPSQPGHLLSPGKCWVDLNPILALLLTSFNRQLWLYPPPFLP